MTSDEERLTDADPRGGGAVRRRRSKGSKQEQQEAKSKNPHHLQHSAQPVWCCVADDAWAGCSILSAEAAAWDIHTIVTSY